MGLISRIRDLFKKNIECGEELNGHFIYLYPNRNRVVYVNASIVVDDNHFAVFVCNDRVCDVLPSGKHRIDNATLPKSFSRLHLDKAYKNGKSPKTFYADIYYVYKKVMEKQTFCASEKFIKKSNRFGKVKGYCEGVCDLQVYDPEMLMKYLLFGQYMLKNKTGLTKSLNIVGNEVNKIFESLEVGFTDIILRPEILNSKLNPAINDKVEDFGIRAHQVEVTSFKLDKKMQRKVSDFLAEHNMYESEFEKSGIKFSPNDVLPSEVDMHESTDNSSAQPDPPIIKRGDITSTDQPSGEYSTTVGSNEIFSQSDKKVCKICGNTIDVGYTFCPYCGSKQ